MSFELPKLPYAKDALTPHMSAETFDYHYAKHHAAYINKLNELIEGKPQASQSLDDIILNSDGALFNQAAQHWNHSFFWKCLRPNGGGEPTGDIAAAIVRDFGSYEAFKQQLAAKAVGQFGSGWAWLVAQGGKLSVTSTANADLPMKHGQTALLTIDVWEHAYYVDYRNARPKFVETVIDKLVDWDFVGQNLKNAR